MRTRAVFLAIGLVVTALLAPACGGSSDAADTTTTTTTAEPDAGATTTTASTGEEATTTTVDAETTTTEGDDAPAGPVGDEKLVPLLLEPADFADGLVYDDATDSEPTKDYCDGVNFSTDWDATATMSATILDEKTFLAASESIIEFASGDATKFMAEVPALTAKCATVDKGQPPFDLQPLAGVGDEALAAQVKEGEDGVAAGGIEVAFVRVGDQVAVLFAISDTQLLTTDLLTKAADRVRNGS